MTLSMRMAVMDTETGVILSTSERILDGVTAEEWAAVAEDLVARYLDTVREDGSDE